MKFTSAQQRAYNAMRAAADCTLTSGHGVTRTTVEALERMGLALVTRTLGHRDVHHRDGRTTSKVTVEWSAQLKPRVPGEDMLTELDEIVDGVRRIEPRHHEALAAYAALTAPAAVLDGAPAQEPDYSPAAAYAHHLHSDTAALVRLYRALRHVTGQRPLDIPEPPDRGPVTNIWIITAPGTPQEPGQELCRVMGATHNDACLAANSLLNRRGGYDARRLGEKELGKWRYDFRAGGRVLRLAATGDGREHVTEVATGRTVVIRGSVAAAERDARAEVESLTSALTDR